MKSLLSRTVIYLILFLSAFEYGCIEDNQAYTTFTGDMVYSFLKKDTAYSECIKIIDRAGLCGMLNAYGSYTLLAPTNSAFRKYYATLGHHFTIDSLRQGEIDTIARTHILSNIILTEKMNDGVLPNLNMDQRYIEVKFTADEITNNLKIMLNDSSQIISKDNLVYNGVVQGISRVLTPSNVLLPDMIQSNPEFSVFYEAMKLTHLTDSILKTKDGKYHQTMVLKNESENGPAINMTERKFAYTVFVEDNNLLKSYGINNLSDLIAKATELYPSGKGYEGDYTHRMNSLNQYIAYHLVNKVIFSNKFFYTTGAVKGFTPDEFIETMLPFRIIKASLLNQATTLNSKSEHSAILKDGKSKTTINGVYHLLDKMLVYDTSVENMLLNTRLRFDVASLFPEFANNGIRCSKGVTQPVDLSWGDIYAFEPSYLPNCKISKDTRLIYLAGIADSWYANFQSDELKALGAFDFTVRLLPVPPGTYELRFNYAANSSRAVTQLFVDNKPAGIPIDMTVGSADPRIGYIADKNTEDNGFENDKMMRNRGYMKCPNTWTYNGATLRDYAGDVRRIIGTYTFTEYGAHTLRFKACTSDTKKQAMVNFIELVPKNISNPPSGDPESRE